MIQILRGFFRVVHLGRKVSHLYRTFQFFVGQTDKTDTFQELCYCAWIITYLDFFKTNISCKIRESTTTKLINSCRLFMNTTDSMNFLARIDRLIINTYIYSLCERHQTVRPDWCTVPLVRLVNFYTGPECLISPGLVPFKKKFIHASISIREWIKYITAWTVYSIMQEQSRIQKKSWVFLI
jgi:hypothetical protein